MTKVTDATQKHINALAAEVESKRKAGRPSANDREAIEVICSKPETRKQFAEGLDNLVNSKRLVNQKQKIHRDDVSSFCSAFGISKGYVNKCVDGLVKGNLQQEIEKNSDLSDLMQIIVEEKEKLLPEWTEDQEED